MHQNISRDTPVFENSILDLLSACAIFNLFSVQRQFQGLLLLAPSMPGTCFQSMKSHIFRQSHLSSAEVIGYGSGGQISHRIIMPLSA